MLTFRTSAASYFYLSALTDKASRSSPTADGGKWSNFQNWAVGGKFENDGLPDDRNKYGPVIIGETLSFSMTIASDGQSWQISSNGAQDTYPISESECSNGPRKSFFFGGKSHLSQPLTLSSLTSLLLVSSFRKY